MIVKAKKYGNSHTITIPPALWDFFHFNEHTKFSFENEGGNFVIRVKSNAEESMNRIDQQYSSLFKRLADK